MISKCLLLGDFPWRGEGGIIACERETHLYCFSSSMTCMPCSYLSLALTTPSPTEAKWPFIVMMDGAVRGFESCCYRRTSRRAGIVER